MSKKNKGTSWLLRNSLRLGTVVTAAFIVTYCWLRFGWPPPVLSEALRIERHASIGDAMAPFAVLFSGLALLVALDALRVQREEFATMLDQQRHATQLADEAVMSQRAVALAQVDVMAAQSAERFEEGARALERRIGWALAVFKAGGTNARERAQQKALIEELNASDLPSIPAVAPRVVRAVAEEARTALGKVREAVVDFGVILHARMSIDLEAHKAPSEALEQWDNAREAYVMVKNDWLEALRDQMQAKADRSSSVSDGNETTNVLEQAFFPSEKTPWLLLLGPGLWAGGGFTLANGAQRCFQAGYQNAGVLLAFGSLIAFYWAYQTGRFVTLTQDFKQLSIAVTLATKDEKPSRKGD